MNTINKIVGIFGYQLIKNNVKLPTKTKSRNKITDDNQSIKNGIVNESDSKPNLRSKIKPKPILKRKLKS
jgi:hypothetical protein